MNPWHDPAWFFLAGHLLHAESSQLRRQLLYVFARHLEIPFLKLGYRGTVGDWRGLARNAATRRALQHLVLRPISRHIDTAHPMITADVIELLERQDGAIAIGACRCRLAHGRCGHTLETDLVIRTGTEAFRRAFPDEYRVIDRPEAERLIRSFAAQGLFHMVFVHCPHGDGMNEYVVCNCCTDGCVPFLLNRVYGQEGFPLVRGEHVAYLRLENCRGCGECLAVCPWEARALVDGKASVDRERCFGCGLCARQCANEAVELRRERPRPPLRTYGSAPA